MIAMIEPPEIHAIVEGFEDECDLAVERAKLLAVFLAKREPSYRIQPWQRKILEAMHEAPSEKLPPFFYVSEQEAWRRKEEYRERNGIQLSFEATIRMIANFAGYQSYDLNIAKITRRRLFASTLWLPKKST